MNLFQFIIFYISIYNFLVNIIIFLVNIMKSNTITSKKKIGGKWSLKYKKSINCKHPKGFSQRQHCKYGRTKINKKHEHKKRK